MEWTGICLTLAAVQLIFAKQEAAYEWSSESLTTFEFPDEETSWNWIDKSNIEHRFKAHEDTYLWQICSTEDPILLYELNEQVGQGNFGKVYRGKRKRDGTPVAIKMIAMDQHTDMLVREVKALDTVTRAQRRPKSLPIMYAAYKDVTDAMAGLSSTDPDRKRLWIVMEWVDGMSLAASIRNDGYFEVSQVRTVMKQVMDTLCYIHGKHKLIHGDLTPQNVMLIDRHDLSIKFVDFGLSRIVGESPSRIVAWELGKAGEMVYRLLFRDMPKDKARGGVEERMKLSQVCNTPELAVKIPSDALEFMEECARYGAEACQLKDHAFLRDVHNVT